MHGHWVSSRIFQSGVKILGKSKFVARELKKVLKTKIQLLKVSKRCQYFNMFDVFKVVLIVS